MLVFICSAVNTIFRSLSF